MASVIAGAMLFVAMSYIGLIVKNQYKMRHKFIKDMQQFANYTLREVTHYKTPINTIIEKYMLTNNSIIVSMLTKYKDLEVIKTYQGIYDTTNYLYLKKSDRALITNFLQNIGKSSYSEEIKHIQVFISEICMLESQANEALTKEGRLYFQLLSLIGLALMIIVV